MRSFKSILTVFKVFIHSPVAVLKPVISSALLLFCCLQLGGCFSADENAIAPAEATTGGAEGEPEFQITTAFRVDAGPDIIADASTLVELQGRVQSIGSSDVEIVEFRWRFYEVNTGYVTQFISSDTATLAVEVPDLAVGKSLVYQFIATDSLGRSAADTATLEVVPLEVFVSISTATTTLQPGVASTLQLTLSDPLDEALVIPYRIESGTADVGVDINICDPCEVSFPPGVTEATITLLPLVEELVEPDENFTVTISPTPVTIAGQNTIEFTIQGGDTTPPVAPVQISEMGSATHLVCVDQDSTGTQCWGDFSQGKTMLPALGEVIKLEGAQDYMCALHSVGASTQFNCWGAGPTPPLAVPQDFVATDTRLCGISAAGNASCVDLLGRQVALGAGTHLVGNEAGVCVTGVAAGQAECDTDTATSFANTLTQINEVTELEIIKPFQLNNDTQGGWCGVAPAGIVCHWLGAGVNTTFVPSLTNPSHLQMHVDEAGVMACVIDQGLGQSQSTVECWNGLGSLPSPFAGLVIEQPYALSAAQSSHICVAHLGGLECVATLNGARYGVAQTAASDITVGSDHICSVHEGITHCWTNANVDFAPLPSNLTNAVAVEAELAQTCAKDSTGRLYCWGGTLTSPVEYAITGALPFTVGTDFQCNEGAAVLACDGFFGASNVVAPSTLSGASALAAGDAHACGLFSGTVTCWGSDSSGESSVPLALQARTDISVLDVGSRTSCAYSAGLGLRCWGETSKLNSSGAAIDLSPPATGQAVIEQIAVGQFHICARTADNVVCWGENGSGQTNIPLNIGTLTDLAVGDTFTCVVNNGRPQCWGEVP